MYVDLGAERLLAAERAGKRIAVEIKSFAGDSALRDVEQSIGQFVVYNAVLSETNAERELYLAVPAEVLREVFLEPLGQLLVQRVKVRLIGFDPSTQKATTWMP